MLSGGFRIGGRRIQTNAKTLINGVERRAMSIFDMGISTATYFAVTKPDKPLTKDLIDKMKKVEPKPFDWQTGRLMMIYLEHLCELRDRISALEARVEELGADHE